MIYDGKELDKNGYDSIRQVTTAYIEQAWNKDRRGIEWIACNTRDKMG